MQLSPAIFFCFNSLVINAFRLLSELYNTFIIPYFFVWELFFTRFFACVILNIYICIKFQEKEVAYCLFVRHETFGSRLISCKTKYRNILFTKIN